MACESFITPQNLNIRVAHGHTYEMWELEWNAISRRIAGIVEASTFLFHTRENDAAFSTNILADNCKETALAIKALTAHRGGMPPKAVEALDRFSRIWDQTVYLGNSGFPATQAFVVALASFRAEFDYSISDHDAIVGNRVLRAFEHLQRCLVVDRDLHEKWEAAFQAGEVACEGLGAAHLLLHGIWGFKTSATGEKTDLVLGTRLVVDDRLIASANGLVLTEWKLVRTGDDPEKKMRQGLKQAGRYSDSILSGFEVTSERYVVLVGEKEFKRPEDIPEGSIKYICVPIYLNRDSPSVAARK